MNPNEIARVQGYLRRTLGNDRITVAAPERKGGPVEILIDDEFIGTLHRDDDEGEISYSVTLTILEMDLPPASPVTGKGK